MRQPQIRPSTGALEPLQVVRKLLETHAMTTFDRVDTSREALAFLSVGDAFIGLVSYGVTSLLAAAGPASRPRRSPWLPLALGLKSLVDTLQAARLTRDQWVEHRAFCSWCLLAAGATFATLPLTLPEARVALRSARNDGRYAGHLDR